MDGEIAVSGVKPDGLAQFAHRLQTKKRVALDAPSVFFAEQTGEDVSDGIEVGGNVEAPPFEIVTGVYDDREVFGGDDSSQAIDTWRRPCLL